MINIDLGKVSGFITEAELFAFQDDVRLQLQALYKGTGPGNGFLGWIGLPSATTGEALAEIEETAANLRRISEVVVIIGIGGSYLGARALIEALSHPFGPWLNRKKDPQILYAGHHLDEDYHAALLELLDQKEYSLVVISKSGTTTEPAVAFRLLKNHLEKKYGKGNLRDRIVAITDKHKGALKGLAGKEGYRTFEVPDDVGGRYSVLTPVGLLPVAIAGIDIRKLLAGAMEMEAFAHGSDTIGINPVATYAAARNALYRKGKLIEILVSYNPGLTYITEWWKQLYGESEGKQGKGIFPAGVSFTTDLHSMGQYIQDGARHIFETVISVDKAGRRLAIPKADDDADGLNYIAGNNLHYVNLMAELGTLLAHVDGGVPNISIKMDRVSPENLGQLIYFFELACGLSGYLLGVNPFDQPGVETYKKNMFALLGKPGFEKDGEVLRARLK